MEVGTKVDSQQLPRAVSRHGRSLPLSSRFAPADSIPVHNTSMDPDSRTPEKRRWRTRRLPHYDYADPDHAFFVTACAAAGTTPFTNPHLAQEAISTLDWLRTNRSISLYAFCLMPDHVHLLLRLGERRWTLGDIMRSLKGFTTKRSWQLGYRGPLWQVRFYDHIVRRSEDGQEIAAYILHNPVRAGLVLDASEYPYSGLPDPM